MTSSSTGPRPILVAVDFSESSRRALEVASALARRMEAPLLLLHVWNTRHLAGSAKILPQLEAWLGEQKTEVAHRLETWASEVRSSGLEVTARVEDGVASRQIPDIARLSRARLVALGRRGTAELAHVKLGSVCERVVHQSQSPVLVVPGRTSRTDAPRKLLVGVDFSNAASEAYQTALRFAEALGGETSLVLAHVRPPDLEAWLESGIERAYNGGYRYDGDALARWAERPGASSVFVQYRVLEGRPEEVLVAGAAEEGCDWLVLGLQGRTALAALLIGSTTDRILKLTDRPVLVVPTTFASPGEATS